MLRFWFPSGLLLMGADKASTAVPNGTKIRPFEMFFCPAGAVGFSPGFQPWETSKKAVRPERARDYVGPNASDCYRKGKRVFVRQRDNLPMAKIMRTSTKWSACGP